MQALHQGASEPSQATFHGVQQRQVAGEQAHHRGEVGGAPVTVDISLAGADRAVAGDQAPEGSVQHADLGAQAGMGIAELEQIIAVDEPQVTVAQPAQLAQHGATQQAGAYAAVGTQRGFRG
ncbi:hypothetical protein FQZ97_1197070 [compost metagenome]